MMADPYVTLGVPRDADSVAILQAFRRSAQKWHPDRNGGSVEAHRRFIAIVEAHDLLSSPEKRARWDAQSKTPPQDTSFTRGSRWSGRSDQRVEDGEDNGDHKSSVVNKAGDVHGDRATVIVSWPLAKALVGGVARVSARICVVCPQCSGLRSTCRLCGGTGQRLRTKTWEVSLPPGTPDGARIRLRGAGHSGPRFSTPGDVEIVVVWTKKGGWRWRADRIEQTIKVKRKLLATGSLSLRTPAGHMGTVKVAPDVVSGTWLRIPGLGMKQPDGGQEDVWVQVIVRD